MTPEAQKTETKMTPTDAIVRMVHAVNNDNDADFYKVVHEFAETMAFGGSNRSRILSTIRLKPTRLKKLDDMPANIKKLLIQSKNEDENVFLTAPVESFIETLLIEWANSEVYRLHNIHPRNKILLHGPTGNGKTTIARYIARKSELPFVEINSDIVLDSHIGGTSTNIHNILNSINEPCVLFWDEVDSIGAKRGGDTRAAGMENDRMVNSILVNLQKIDHNIIFIGATNRLEVLDSAFLRRFDAKIEIPAPSQHELAGYITQLIEHYGLTAKVNVSINNIASYSDAKLRVTEEARKYLLQNIKNQ